MTTSASARDEAVGGAGERQVEQHEGADARPAPPRAPTTTAAQRSERGASGRARRRARAPTAAAAGAEQPVGPGGGGCGGPPLCSVTTARLRGPRRWSRPPSSPANRAPRWLAWRSCARSWWSTLRPPAPRRRCGTCSSAPSPASSSSTSSRPPTAGTAASSAPRPPPTGIDLVVSVGGDGTVNEVVNGLLENGPGAAPADAGRRARGLDQRLLPRARALPRPGRGDRGDPRLAAGRPDPPGVPRHRERVGHQHRPGHRRRPVAAAAVAERTPPGTRRSGRRRAGSSSPPGWASTPRSSPASRPTGRRDGGPPARSTSRRRPAPSCSAGSAAVRP